MILHGEILSSVIMWNMRFSFISQHTLSNKNQACKTDLMSWSYGRAPSIPESVVISFQKIKYTWKIFKYHALKTSEVLLLWMCSLAFPFPAEISRCEELLHFCSQVFQTFSKGRLYKVFHCPLVFHLFYSGHWRNYTTLSYSFVQFDY